MTNRDRRNFDTILREPLTRQRLLLNNKIRAAQQGGDKAVPFTFGDLTGFLNGLQKPGRAADAVLTAEIANALSAVQTGQPLKAPKFETPETQLVWGAALGFLLLNPDQMQTWATPVAAGELRSSALWKDIVNTKRAHQELLTHAHHVREALRDKNTKYGWSDPGSGFTFQRQKNIINIDLMQSLIVGFEHARADVYREVGQSLLSVAYPARMQQIYTELVPLRKKMQEAQGKKGGKGGKSKGTKLSDDEYKRLRLLSAEWQLRHMLFSAAEENVTSRFVASMGKQMLQDYSVSMNNTGVTFRGLGLTRLPPKEEASDALRRYMNLCNTVQLSFYQNNSLFDNTDDGWYRVGVDPSMVRKLSTLAARPDNAKGDKDGISHADFIYLRELCGGPAGLENLQPRQQERLFGWSNLKNRIARASADRVAIMEKIWALYAEDLIQEILNNLDEKLDEELEQAKQNQQDQDQDQDGQDQDGQDGQDGQEGQEGQEGQDGQEGQGQGQKGKKGKKDQKDKKNQKQKNKPQGDQVDPDDLDDADGQDGQKQKDQKDKKGEKGEKGEKDQDGQDDQNDQNDQNDQDGADGEDGQEQEGEGDNSRDAELGRDKDNKVPVDGAGDMDAPSDDSFEDPSHEQDPDAGNDADGEGQDGEGNEADGQDGDGEDADADDGNMTEDELEKAVQEAEEAENGDDADGQDGQDGEDADADADGQGKKSRNKKPGKQAGQEKGRLGDLSKQDWTQYQQRINELAPTINRVRKLFKDIQNLQLQRKRVQSPKLDMIPENGEVMDRFNQEAHRNLTLKKKTGQMTPDDLKRFHLDQVEMIPAEIDVVLLIDGSSSMNGKPLDSALQAAAIMFEAAAGKDMNINVYVCMWGDQNPPVIIRPGADRVQIGQAMQVARKGLNSGTAFAPAVKKVAETIGEERGKSGVLAGFTHVLILSDGDIFDEPASVESIKTMFTHCDKVTFDTAIISKSNSKNSGTRMEKMARSVTAVKAFQEVGVTLGHDPDVIPLEIVGLLLEKVRKCGSFKAVPSAQKRRQMQQAHNKLDKK